MEQLMKAGVVHAPFDIRYEDIKRPIPGKGQVLVKVKYTAINSKYYESNLYLNR